MALPCLAFSANASQFEKIDLNKDQALSASEFVAANYSIADFKSADRNQNQKVTQAEFASFKTSLSKPQERKNSGPNPPHG